MQRASTVHPRRGLNALLASAAIVVIAAVVALVVWMLPLATSEDETEYIINHKAELVSGVQAGLVSSFHNDAGNIPSSTGTTRVPGSGGVPAVTGTTRAPGSGLD